MRPPRLRCTLFPLIYPPHLLDSYKRQLYGFVLFSRLTKRNLASYVISVRRTKSLLTASFRFYLTIDTLAVQLYTSLSPRRVRDFHPLERAHGAQTKNTSATICHRGGISFAVPLFFMRLHALIPGLHCLSFANGLPVTAEHPAQPTSHVPTLSACSSKTSSLLLPCCFAPTSNSLKVWMLLLLLFFAFCY